MKAILLAVGAGACWGVGEIFTKSVLHTGRVGPLTALDTTPVPGKFESPIKVHLDFKKGTEEACPYFVGRFIRGVKNTESVAEHSYRTAVIAFVLAALSFVPLGQVIACRLQEFRVRSSALWGYSFDIMGSLVGVIVFALMGLVGTFPVQWFGLLMIAGAWLFLPAPGSGQPAVRAWSRSAPPTSPPGSRSATTTGPARPASSTR